jgi:hypothetical protein
MNINFETLEQIPTIYKMLLKINEKLENKVDKRWLSTIETSQYLGYSKDSIDFMVKKGEFIIDIHYFQRERKRIFDKEALDKWVMGISEKDNDIQQNINITIEDIVSSIAA